MDEKNYYTIILRHDTSTNWMLVDPILALGEYGVEDDTHRIKRGDGETAWSDLTYDHFGFEYAITFENLQGNVEDNAQLVEKFNNVANKEDFANEDNKILLDINIKQEDNIIARLTRTDLNLTTNENENTVILDIVSDDNSINGLWYTSKQGVQTLNLQTTEKLPVVKDFNEEETYNIYTICLYNGILYRTTTTVEPGVFDENEWEALSTLTADKLTYDPENTTLESTTVQDAITEVATKIQNIEDNNNLIII